MPKKKPPVKKAKSKKPAAKKTATKKAAAKKTSKTSGTIGSTKARILFKQIQDLLGESDLGGRVHELHLTESAGFPVDSDCPPPRERRRVCFRGANGRVVCEWRCV